MPFSGLPETRRRRERALAISSSIEKQKRDVAWEHMSDPIVGRHQVLEGVNHTRNGATPSSLSIAASSSTAAGTRSVLTDRIRDGTFHVQPPVLIFWRLLPFIPCSFSLVNPPLSAPRLCCCYPRDGTTLVGHAQSARLPQEIHTPP